MPLGSALVDRARTVRQRPTSERVEGTTIFATTHGDWFKCRLTQPESPQAGDGGGRTRVVRQATLMCGVRDLVGGSVALTSDMRVEVDSPQLGRSLWDITADPEPLRKRRRVIGFQTAVSRVEDHPFERPIP